MNTSLKLLICDLDGTLVDSKYDLAAALTYALEPFGKGPIQADEIPPLLGSGLSALLRMTLGDVPAEAHALAKQRFDAYYQAHTSDLSVCYPGVSETLGLLTTIKKAVFSNKSQPFTIRVLEEMALDRYFDMALGAQPERYPLKPAPDGIRMILQNLGVAPEEALMVGDSTHDIEAAHAAGVRACAVTYGYRPAAALAPCAPDYMIDSFQELRDLIDTLR